MKYYVLRRIGTNPLRALVDDDGNEVNFTEIFNEVDWNWIKDRYTDTHDVVTTVSASRVVRDEYGVLKPRNGIWTVWNYEPK